MKKWVIAFIVLFIGVGCTRITDAKKETICIDGYFRENVSDPSYRIVSKNGIVESIITIMTMHYDSEEIVMDTVEQLEALLLEIGEIEGFHYEYTVKGDTITEITDLDLTTVDYDLVVNMGLLKIVNPSKTVTLKESLDSLAPYDFTCTSKTIE